jgi:tetratricopeptide (TPR) repeat protein
MEKKIMLIFLFLLALFPKGNHLLAQGIQTPEEVACIQIDKGEIDKAIEILQKVLEASPNNLNAQLYQGVAFFLKEDAEAAFQVLNKIEKEINRMVGAGRSFGDDAMFAAMAMDRRSGVIFSEERKGLLCFCLGLTLKEKKDLKNAEKKFKNALKLKYDEMSTRLHLFDLYIEMRNLKSAASQIDELKKISGENDLLIFLDGYLKYRNDKTEDALETFESVASTIGEAKKNIARLYYNKGDYQKSLEIWQGILSETLDDKDALINSGRISFHLGDSQKAQEYFSKAGIQTSPEKISPKNVPLVYETQMKEIKFDLKCK